MESKKKSQRSFAGSTVLITGGTGSIGRSVLERLLKEKCAEIRIFSRDENKQNDMKNKYAGAPIRYYLGDVRDLKSLQHPMRGVDFVFHAAALKQVPAVEAFPMEAIQTNVLGSSNVIETAVNQKVKALVCLSTDKAVFPVSTLGITKALMEKLLQATVRSGASDQTVLSCVRYGNVLCSRGSVIPLFLEQILSGQPLTITDSNMTRFMLDPVSAVDMVLYALQAAHAGDTLVHKSPACTIDQLAKAMLRLFGSRQPVKSIGIRFGEKIHESLLTDKEMATAEDLGEFLRIPLNGGVENKKRLANGISDYNSANAARLTDAQLDKLLLAQPEVKAALEIHRPSTGRKAA